MKNRKPCLPNNGQPIPDFAPVPRKCNRHDGWTPARQKAFIEALADTGVASRAAAMVNMTVTSAYQMRRQPGAEGFRRAWEAALDFGVQRMKDIAFERAIEGQLVPVFVGGRLHGFRRKKNDRLLMFCLRHYGQDASGRRTTINYFSASASANTALSPLPLPGEGDSRSERGEGKSLTAEAGATTLRTAITAPAEPARTKPDLDDARADILNNFEPALLDDQAQAEIQAALEAAADRRRARDPDLQEHVHGKFEVQASDPDLQEHVHGKFEVQASDPDCDFIRTAPDAAPFAGELESGVEIEDFVPFADGEPPWQSIGAPVPAWFVEWEKEQADKQAALPPPADPLAGACPLHEEGGLEAPISPRTGKPLRHYRKRTPKPPFTPPELALKRER